MQSESEKPSTKWAIKFKDVKERQAYSGPDNHTDMHAMELLLKKIYLEINASRYKSGQIDTE